MSVKVGNCQVCQTRAVFRPFFGNFRGLDEGGPFLMFSVGPASQFLASEALHSDTGLFAMRLCLVWVLWSDRSVMLIARSLEIGDSGAGLAGEAVVMSIPEDIAT